MKLEEKVLALVPLWKIQNKYENFPAVRYYLNMKTILAVSALVIAGSFTLPASPCRSGCDAPPPPVVPTCYYGVVNPFSGYVDTCGYSGWDAWAVCSEIAGSPYSISATYCDEDGCDVLL